MQAASTNDHLSAIRTLGSLLAANFEEIEQRRELPSAVVTALTELESLPPSGAARARRQ